MKYIKYRSSPFFACTALILFVKRCHRNKFKLFLSTSWSDTRGSWGTAPLILNLDCRWEWWTLRLCIFTRGKEPQCQFSTRVGGHQRRFGRFGENNPSTEFRTLGLLARNLSRLPHGDRRECNIKMDHKGAEYHVLT